MATLAPTPVPPVSIEQLVEVASPALNVAGPIPGYNDALNAFAADVQTRTQGFDPLDSLPLFVRSILLFEAVFEHHKRFAAEGIWAPPTNGKPLKLSGSVLNAVATTPLKFRIVGQGMELLYKVDDLVRLAKQEAPVELAPEEPWQRGSVVDPALANALGDLADMAKSLGLPEGLTMGELASRTQGEPIDFTYDLDDFPRYRDMIARRKELLGKVSREDARVYAVERHAQNHPSVQTAAWSLDAMGPELAAKMGVGPQAQYPMLDAVAEWDFARYWSVVSKSDVHANICCLNGVYPALYVARHGTLSQFRRIHELAREVFDQVDAEGRPLLLDLARMRDSEKFRYAASQVANLYASTPVGQTAMFCALVASNADAVEYLLSLGYDLRRDESVDQPLVQRFLSAGRCSPELRVLLAEVLPSLSVRSEIGRFMDEATAGWDEMTAGFRGSNT